MALILRFRYCEHIQIILDGELKICLWSLVSHEMTLTRCMSSFSGLGTLSLALWVESQSFCGKSEMCHQMYM